MFYFFKPIALFHIKCRNNIPFPQREPKDEKLEGSKERRQ